MDRINSSSEPSDRFLTTEQVATRLQMTRGAFEQLRRRGGGPPVVRISSHVLRYRESDLNRWCDERTEAAQ